VGKAIKKLGQAIGIGKKSSPGPKLNQELFDQRVAVDERTAAARQASQGLITDLQKQARGEGPSLAAEQLKSASSRNLAQTLAAASAQRGGNPALAQRNIMQQKGQADRAVAEQSAIARMQEQQSAQNQLANLTLGQQSQDLGQVMQPAQLRAQGETARFAADVARRNAVRAQQQSNLNSLFELGAQGASAAMMASDKRQKMPLDTDLKSCEFSKIVMDDGVMPSNDATSMSGKELSDEKPKSKSFNISVGDPKMIEKIANRGTSDNEFSQLVEKFQIPDEVYAKKKKEGGGAGGMASMAPMLASAISDERQKTSVGKVNPKKDIKDFLNKIEARSYVYKNPEMKGAAPGKRYGVMAQDLEKSEVGKSLVKDTEQGKVVDTVQGFGAVLAAQAELNNRLKKLEKGKK